MARRYFFRPNNEYSTELVLYPVGLSLKLNADQESLNPSIISQCCPSDINMLCVNQSHECIIMGNTFSNVRPYPRSLEMCAPLWEAYSSIPSHSNITCCMPSVLRRAHNIRLPLETLVRRSRTHKLRSSPVLNLAGTIHSFIKSARFFCQRLMKHQTVTAVLQCDWTATSLLSTCILTSPASNPCRDSGIDGLYDSLHSTSLSPYIKHHP
jgi:hypothetical protein